MRKRLHFKRLNAGVRRDESTIPAKAKEALVRQRFFSSLNQLHSLENYNDKNLESGEIIMLHFSQIFFGTKGISEYASHVNFEPGERRITGFRQL